MITSSSVFWFISPSQCELLVHAITELTVHSRANIIELMVHEDKARKEFASRLALACENAGYEQHGRQAEIARRMKLTPKAVSKWFNGETIPRREKLRELATLIGTTPTYLLGEDTEESGQVRFYQELNPRQKIIIDLLDELPDSETDELLKTLEEKKQKYNAIYEELARKKKQKAS